MSAKAVQFHYAARSDVGLVRSNNQDSGYAGANLLVLAARGSAHAVGENEEVGAGVAGVLVVGAHEAHVGAGSVVKLNGVS